MSYDHVPTASPAVRGLAVTFGAALIGAHLTLALASCSGGCSSPPPQLPEAGGYVLEIEACIQRYRPDQCEERVACERGVEQRYGLKSTSSCAPVDGGDQ